MTGPPARTLRGGRATGDELLTDGARALWARARDEEGCRPECTSLRLQTPCMFGNGPVPCDAMVITDAPTDEDDVEGTPGHGLGLQLLDSVLRGNDVDLADVYQTYAVKCVPPDGRDKKPDLKIGRKTCAGFLETELRAVRPKVVLAMGAEAFYFFVHRDGITKARGQAFWSEQYHCWVVPTHNPLAVLITPKLLSAFEADVAKWRRLAQGITEAPSVEIVDVRSLADLSTMLAFFAEEPDKLLTFDLETRGFHSGRDDYSFVWGIDITDGRDLGQGIRVYNMAFEHPDSPWYKDPPVLRYVLQEVTGLLFDDRRRVNGHNVKFDLRWMMRAMERHGLVEVHA